MPRGLIKSQPTDADYPHTLKVDEREPPRSCARTRRSPRRSGRRAKKEKTVNSYSDWRPLPLLCFAFLSLALTACPGSSPSFGISLNPQALSVAGGESKRVQVVLSRTGGFRQAVAISIDDLPDGVSAEPVEIATGASEGELTVTAAPGASPGDYELAIVASSGSLTRNEPDNIFQVAP